LHRGDHSGNRSRRALEPRVHRRRRPEGGHAQRRTTGRDFRRGAHRSRSWRLLSRARRIIAVTAAGRCRFPSLRHGVRKECHVQVVTSASAAARLQVAGNFLRRHLPGTEIVIVGASRGAADDLARSIAREVGATFGFVRFSLTELAARAAAAATAGTRLPGTQAGAEAIAARAVFDAVAAGELDYLAPVASFPGFPKALARTLHELRLAGVSRDRLDGDLRVLLTRVEDQRAT